MARPLDVPLQEDGAVAERRLRLAHAAATASSSSAALRTTRIPRPPPPAAAFTSNGNPSSSAVPSWTTGTPAARAIRFAASLSPPRRRAFAGGPTQIRPASTTAWAKSGLSARKPYPGWIASAPASAAARRCSAISRYDEISTVASASRACSEPRSSGATTATARIPSRRHVRKTRSAISPRLATSRLSTRGIVRTRPSEG